jgi:hypothetical protein
MLAKSAVERTRRRALLASAAMLVLFAGLWYPAASVAAQYGILHTWIRAKQWTPGVELGSSEGNPSPDKKGEPVWGYWVTSGDGLGTELPWYASERTAMVWDSFQHPGKPERLRWARPEADEPAISQYLITHSRTERFGAWPYQAVMSWANPAGDGAMIDLTGTAVLNWGSQGQYDIDYDAELAIVKHVLADDSYEVLMATSFARPAEPIDRNKWQLEVPIVFRGLRFDAGDELLVSISNPAGEAAPRDAWIGLNDRFKLRLKGYELSSWDGRAAPVSSVPEPHGALLGGAGLVFLMAVVAVGRRQTDKEQ